MNQDDIIRMAHEAGMYLYNADQFKINHGYRDVDIETMEKFAALVAAAEREECAKIVELKPNQNIVFKPSLKYALIERAKAIRARGQHG